VVRKGRFSAYSVTRVLVTRALVDGRTYELRSPVLVIADERWSVVPLGARISFGGRLQAAAGPDVAAVVSTHRSPRVRAPPAVVMDAAAAVRAEIRSAVSRAGPDERALVPALVVGDDKAMSPRVVDDFRTTGLTHLAAVSGTNLTLVVGFLLVIARWTGVRARGLTLVGLLGILVAWGYYGAHWFSAAATARTIRPIYLLLVNKYYLDDLYNWLVGRVLMGLSDALAWFDRHVVDGAVNGAAWLAYSLVGWVLTRAESGRLPNYALVFFVGVILLAGAIVGTQLGH
jgi:hypothetical protein